MSYEILTVADKKAEELFGDSFCAISADGTCEIFSGDCGNAVLMGQGPDFDSAFEQAIPFFERFIKAKE